MAVKRPAYENPTVSHSFWRDAFGWRGSITSRVLGAVLAFGIYGALVFLLNQQLGWGGIEVTHVQYTGGLLVLLLVLRTNAGYERWWEARKLWGGIVNQSRNLVVDGLAYGPRSRDWQERFVHWSIAFCHATRRSLRGEREAPELARVLNDDVAVRGLLTSQHMPSHVARRLAELLVEAREAGAMDGWAFQQVDRERASLIDHLGGCERILKTPLPRVHSIKVRRFILIYLLALPFALGLTTAWGAALITMLVAYPLLAIDQIGMELENPFSVQRASHLPLDLICETIEGNLLALLEDELGREA